MSSPKNLRAARIINFFLDISRAFGYKSLPCDLDTVSKTTAYFASDSRPIANKRNYHSTAVNSFLNY